MTDYYLGVTPQAIDWELRSNVRRFSSPDGGVTRTHERVGSRWAARFRWDVVGGADAARLRAFIAQQRGGANRFWVRDPAYSMRGSFAAPELLTNNDFSSPNTTWSVSSPWSGVIADSVMRFTRTRAMNTTDVAAPTSASSVTQYAPYAARSVDIFGRQALGSGFISGVQLGTTQFGEEYGRTTVASSGLRTFSAVSRATSLWFGLVDYALSGANMAGDYYEVRWTSLARCALVDNGPNALTYSDQLNNAAWSKGGSSILADAANAPDGAATADLIVEDGTTGVHYVTQSSPRTSAAADVVAYGFFGRATGTRDVLLVVGSDSSNYGVATFNLGTGAVVSTALVGTATNVRASIAGAGDGFYFCSVVARVVASTTLYTQASMVSGGTSGYTGDGSSSIKAWRCGGAVCSTPTRGQQTTVFSDSDGDPQTGSGLYLRGLPASTNGLLYAGDWVEIITPTYSEFKRVTAPLNSDAAGLGYLQFEPVLRASPADGAAVIIRSPMCRMMLDESTVRTTHLPGGRMAVEFTAVEDVTA